MLSFVGEQRGSLDGFDVVLGGVTAPSSRPTSWVRSRQPARRGGTNGRQRGPDIDSLSAVLRRVEAGAPAL